MCAGVRCPRVLGILRQGSFDLWPGGISLSILRERHAMMSREPPIVAVGRGKIVQQVEERALLPGSTGIADQAVGESGGGEDYCISRPGVHMREHCGKCSLGVACH